MSPTTSHLPKGISLSLLPHRSWQMAAWIPCRGFLELPSDDQMTQIVNGGASFDEWEMDFDVGDELHLLQRDLGFG